jgi:hypothetical protein
MADANWAEVLAARAEVVSAIAVSTTTLVAFYAAFTWRHSLKHQRADECVAAGRGLIGSINRCLSVKSEHNLTEMQAVWQAYDDVWASWRRFDQAFHAARRYYKSKLGEDMPGGIAMQLELLRGWLDRSWAHNETIGRQDGEDVRERVKALLKPIDTL